MKIFTFKKSGRALLFAAAVLATVGLSGCEENRGILLGWIGGDDTAKNHTHTWGNWTVIAPATCDAAGAETRTCTQDANHKETRSIPKLTGTACNSGGNAHTHTWGSWTVTTPATCDAAGTETRTCTQDASHKETRAISKLTGAACNSGGGGELVGDWMAYSRSYDDEIYYADRDGFIGMVSIYSSGEGQFEWRFRKIGNVWVDDYDPDWGYWRTEGQTLIITQREECRWDDRCEKAAYDRISYKISGNKLIWSFHEVEVEHNIDYYSEWTFTRVNVDSLRNSLDGPVYINDYRLYTSSPSAGFRDYFIWYSQNNKDEYLGFPSSSVGGTGLLRYIDVDIRYNVYYYTSGNKLFLIIYVDDSYVEEYLKTVELTYTITGSGSGARLSINGDIWLPIASKEYEDYLNSKQSKRPVVGNAAKSIISPPSARTFGGSRR